MSISLNVVVIGGNITRDPEFKVTEGGTAICKFGVACNRKSKGEDQVSFFDVTTFNRTAELVSEFMKKGSPVLVEGRLQQDRWQNKEGEKRSRIEIIGDRVHFLPKSDGEPSGTGSVPSSGSPGEEGPDPTDMPF